VTCPIIKRPDGTLLLPFRGVYFKDEQDALAYLLEEHEATRSREREAATKAKRQGSLLEIEAWRRPNEPDRRQPQ
jgi:hypothetical protein